VALLAALVIGAWIVVLINGGLDPTEQAFPISILNDSGQVLIVDQCDDSHCRTIHDTQKVQPGSSAVENAAPGIS